MAQLSGKDAFESGLTLQDNPYRVIEFKLYREWRDSFLRAKHCTLH